MNDNKVVRGRCLWMDDNEVVRGLCPWMDDNEVAHGRCPWTMIKNPWMIQLSIQWMDECAILRKIRHVGAVNKPMIIALSSSSS